jgi:pimeloyl-ACP methyl ester carboxylesterase
MPCRPSLTPPITQGSNGSFWLDTRWVRSLSRETAWRHPQRVTQLTYVAGVVPAPGESAARVVIGTDVSPGLPRTVGEAGARSFFGNDLTDGEWADHWRQMVPEAPGLWNARLSGYPRGMPFTYVSMTDDVGVPPELAEQMIANLGGNVEHRVLPAGHTVMVSRPRELAAIINDVVSRGESPILQPAPHKQEVVPD